MPIMAPLRAAHRKQCWPTMFDNQMYWNQAVTISQQEEYPARSLTLRNSIRNCYASRSSVLLPWGKPLSSLWMRLEMLFLRRMEMGYWCWMVTACQSRFLQSSFLSLPQSMLNPILIIRHWWISSHNR